MSPPIFTPDGSEVSEIVLPDGTTASEVIAPDGSTVFGGIPDEQNLQSRYPASSFSLSDGDTISSAWTDTQGSFDAAVNAVNGSPTYRSSAAPSGEPAVEFNENAYFDTGFVQDTDNPRSLYIVRRADSTGNFNTIYGAENPSSGLNADYVRKEDNGDRRGVFANGNTTFGAMTTGSFVIDTVIADGSTLEWYVDGSNVGSVSYTGQGSIGFNDYIAARNASGSADLLFSGEIADILRYTVSHGSSTRSDVETFLSDTYSVF